jgi:aminoglycoside phosphotransferase (APT) family kinase protein
VRPDIRKLLGTVPAGVSIAADRAQGIVTCLVPGVPASSLTRATEPLVARFPSGHATAAAVEREARLLVELRRRGLGPLARTIPRHVGMRDFEGLPVALASTLPGRPMSPADRHRLRAAQPWLVRRDFEYAGAWLSRLHEASATGPAPIAWGGEVTGAVRRRWHDHPALVNALGSLEPAASRLDGRPADRTVVHGDFWHGNVLVDVGHGGVSGVVNWMSGELEGCPLRDLARFALRYSRHAGAGSMRSALWGSGWYARIVQAYLRAGLLRLGLAPDLWRDVALLGAGEIAADDPDEGTALEHLVLLAGAAPRSRLPRQRVSAE